MNKTFRLYGIIFIITLVLLALLQLNKRQVTDWRRHFDVNMKSPFGLFVFNKEVDAVFSNRLVRTSRSPYQFYTDSTRDAHNIIIIEKEIDQESAKKILEQVSKGSDAMIVSTVFPKILADTLKFRTREYVEQLDKLKLTDRKFKSDSLILDKRPSNMVFDNPNEDSEVLGFVGSDEMMPSSNFIKVKWGRGNFYLHSEPLILTNYYLLKPGSEVYVQNVFSYLPDRRTIWFTDATFESSSSPLRFILSQPPLRYAWWLFLASLLMFVVFNVKRRQRIIPIIQPLPNKSVEFVRSIGNLYLQEGDFHDMMAKKAQYFLHRVRTELLLDTRIPDENFAAKLSLKTGTDINDVEKALVLIGKAQDPYAQVTKEDLMIMNTLLDKILK
ncbi:hypothetical protein [Chryseobacterium sp.]|uniref:hypothetical protein n=1 Tax=Chryseobacterium sp. TaxID=1871047 RepID=UPI0012A8CE91|nr:hypothetical protein [Chryseobacterium sp.]QFG52352.1 hypothetical protein F7R58_01820 [Chryseobacterium sp.]